MSNTFMIITGSSQDMQAIHHGHKKGSSFATLATYDDESQRSFSSCSSSSPSRSQVQFDAVVQVHPVPNKEDLDKENLWWQRKEIEMEGMEHFLTACKNQLDKCPRLIRDKKQRQCCEDLQGVVRSTNLLLSSRKLNTNKAATKLHECLDRAPALRSMERRLVPKCAEIMRQHVHLVCSAQKRQSATKLAAKAANSSQGSIVLGQVLARHDFVQAYWKVPQEQQ